MHTSLPTADTEAAAATPGLSFYEKTAGVLLALGAVGTTAADAEIVHWQGAGVIDTGNLAPSGSVVSLQIGTTNASVAYGFVKGIGNLSLPNDSLAGFFRQAGAPTVGSGNTFGSPGGEALFISESTLQNGATFSADNLFAFSFTSGAVNGGNPVYGWARLDIPLGNAFAGTLITEWAYDDTGASIALGAIPEPSGLALLAAGAAGGAACFHRFRSRRRLTDTPAG